MSNYRFDLCEAHYLLERDYHISGVLQERPSNQRRKMSTEYQLSRMKFDPSYSIREYGFNGLSERGKAIYVNLALQYGLVKLEDTTVGHLQNDCFNLVQVDYDVAHTLESIGYINDNDPASDSYQKQPYDHLIVLVGNADYIAVWGIVGIPELSKRADLLWAQGNLI